MKRKNTRSQKILEFHENRRLHASITLYPFPLVTRKQLCILVLVHPLVIMVFIIMIVVIIIVVIIVALEGLHL